MSAVERQHVNMDKKYAFNFNFQIPEKPSRYLLSFLTFIKAMERWRRDEAMALFDDALVHRILPESLQRPVLSKTGYGNYLTGVMPFFGPKFKVTIHEVVEAGHKMAVHCRSQGKTGTGKTYENEYCFFIHFVPLDRGVDPYSPLAPGEELPKIELIKEFVDSTATRGLFANNAT